MKKILSITLVVGIVVGSFYPAPKAHALPAGSAQHPGEYFLGDEELSRWTLGFYYLDRERDITTLGRLRRMDTTKTMAYVGYEFIYGLVGYITAGSAETRFEYLHLKDSQAEYGFGLLFNILDHEIPDPLLMEDRIRINASMQFTQGGASWIHTELNWEEYYGSLTVSLINDIWGNKYYNMDSIGFYFGAVYSDIQSSGVDEENSLGYCAGIEMMMTEKISVDFGMETLDHGSIYVGIRIGL